MPTPSIPPARDAVDLEFSRNGSSTQAARVGGGPASLHEACRLVLEELRRLPPRGEEYATQFVDRLLAFAGRIGASDLHLQPTAEACEVRFRHDGVLQKLGDFSLGATSSIVSRLKVISNLLTYQSEVPQEGRIQDPGELAAEVRVSTYPTLYGERAVLRFFGKGNRFQQLGDLGYPAEITQSIKDTLDETSGALIVCGPAGSGKSTTVFACLRRLVESTGGVRNLMSIEDPIETPIPGVSQSQVSNAAGFDLPTALRSLLRQDPEVILIGEVRDRLTAEIAIQACLTGQLMLTTFHADSAAAAISRLIDMGIEPYVLRSGVIGVLCQRLVRKLCPCKEPVTDPSQFFGLPIDGAMGPGSCEACNHTGYRGRTLICEFMPLKESSLAASALAKKDSREIYRLALDHGMTSLWEYATRLVREGVTSPREVRRVLGVSMRI